MPNTFKEDIIAFFSQLTFSSAQHEKSVAKAIDKLKRYPIENTEENREKMARTLTLFCAGQFGGVKPVLTNDDWKRLKQFEKKYYTHHSPKHASTHTHKK